MTLVVAGIMILGGAIWFGGWILDKFQAIIGQDSDGDEGEPE
jgi:hypothetical protein